MSCSRLSRRTTRGSGAERTPARPSAPMLAGGGRLLWVACCGIDGAMHILVIGSGGREHALAWRLARAGHQVVAAPGNPGIEEVAACVPIGVAEHARLVELAIERQVELVVVGPEAPLVAGLADELRAAGVTTFGPGAAGARLEGSKVFSKQFFARHRIPTAPFAVATTVADSSDLKRSMNLNCLSVRRAKNISATLKLQPISTWMLSKILSADAQNRMKTLTASTRNLRC